MQWNKVSNGLPVLFLNQFMLIQGLYRVSFLLNVKNLTNFQDVV
jgi:hypothetical protein